MGKASHGDNDAIMRTSPTEQGCGGFGSKEDGQVHCPVANQRNNMARLINATKRNGGTR